MIIKIVKEIYGLSGSTSEKDTPQYITTQYKETHHQLYIYQYDVYLREFPDKRDRNTSENMCDATPPEAVITYNYKDGGGGHLHVFKGTTIYLMNNDGKTVDKFVYN